MSVQGVNTDLGTTMSAVTMKELDDDPSHQELWWTLGKVKHEAEESATPADPKSKFDLAPYIGEKPLTDVTFTELVYASMRWAVDFNWMSQAEVKGYMAHIGYIAMKAMAGLYVSGAMSSYDDSVRKLADLQGTCVFMRYNPDFTPRPLNDEYTVEAQPDTLKQLYIYSDCSEQSLPLLSEGKMPHNVDDMVMHDTYDEQFNGMSDVSKHKHTDQENESHVFTLKVNTKQRAPDHASDAGTVTIKSETGVGEDQITSQDINSGPTGLYVSTHSQNDETESISDEVDQAQLISNEDDQAHVKNEVTSIQTLRRIEETSLRLHVSTEGHSYETPITEEDNQVHDVEALIEENPQNMLTHHDVSHIGEKIQKPADEKGKPGKSKEPRAEKHHQCTVCDKKFEGQYLLKQHMRCHTGERPYTCFECGKQYKQNVHLKRHMLKHTPDAAPQICCPVCDKRFWGKSELKQHLRTHTGEKPYKCTQCSRSFARSSALKEHMVVHCKERPHKCSYCGAGFKNSSNLKAHMRLHTGENCHKCPQCDKLFPAPSLLQKHILTHGDKKPFLCPVCGKSFKNSTSLPTHMLIHMDEKPYKCTQCHKGFTTVGQLNKHKENHSGLKTKDLSKEKKYICCHCGKMFSKSDILRDHMMIHTGERRHKCPQCGMQFIQSGNYRKHLRTHTDERPYQCSVCSKLFRWATGLQTHMMIHTGEKPHKCQQCGKAFSRGTMLRRHMRSHTGEKPHACPHCDRHFSQRGNLRQHMRIHSGEKAHKPSTQSSK